MRGCCSRPHLGFLPLDVRTQHDRKQLHTRDYADNAEEVYVNSLFVGNDGPVNSTDYVQTYEWRTVVDYDLTAYLQAGVNQLDFIVRNYALNGGTQTSNPTGLIYDATVEYQYDGNEETAWGDGCDGTSFEGNNWGTYFMYTP